MARSIRPAALLVFTAATFHFQAWSTPLTLNTSWLDANATLYMSKDVRQALAVSGIVASASGKATEVGTGVFNLQVTQSTMDIKLLPPALSLQGAEVVGSSLDFYNSLSHAKASLTNLDIDFNTHIVSGDIVSAKGTSRADLLTFSVTQPLTFSLKDGIAFRLGMGDIHFTQDGAQRFATAMNLPDFMVPVLSQIDFGTIDNKVAPWFRTAVAAVPEPTTTCLLLMGFAGIAATARRRQHGAHAAAGSV